MTRDEQNAKIAEVLGFERGTYTINGRPHGQWIYPKDWQHLRCGSPEHTVPDFVGILRDAVEFARRNSIRRDYETANAPLPTAV